MTRYALIISYALFNLLLISLLWGDSWLPYKVGVTALAIIAAGWAVSAFFLFRHLGLTTRQKIVGWLFLIAFVGFSITRRFSRYYLFAHSSWSMWLAWDGIGLLFVAVSIGLAILIIGKAAPSVADSYTVESEAPDHVLHIESTPNYSLKRTAAKGMR